MNSISINDNDQDLEEDCRESLRIVEENMHATADFNNIMQL
jgi:hypothetical protein